MKRAFRLRRIQILQDSKWPSIAGLFFIVLSLIDYYTTGGNFISSNPEIKDTPLPIILLSLIFIPISLSLFAMLIMDGLSHFDSALRFGISRKNYFMANIVIYILWLFVNIFVSGVGKTLWKGSYSTYFSDIFSNFYWQNLLLTYIWIMCLIIFSYGFYRFGWKVCLVFLIFPILGMATAGLSTMESAMKLYEIFVKIIDVLYNYWEILVIVISIVLTSIYYLCITKIEIQD